MLNWEREGDDVTGRVVFATWWGGGNVTPARVIGSMLTAEGIEVSVVGQGDMAAHLGGLRYTPAPRDAIEWRDLLMDEAGGRPTGLVVDFTMPTVLSVAESLGWPFAALIHTLFQPYPDATAPFVGTFTTLDAINSERDALGLGPIGSAAVLLDRASRLWVTTPPAVDRAASAATPATASFIGPMIEPVEPWEPPAGNAPLGVISFGTTDMGEQEPMRGWGRWRLDPRGADGLCSARS